MFQLTTITPKYVRTNIQTFPDVKIYTDETNAFWGTGAAIRDYHDTYKLHLAHKVLISI